MTLLDHINQAVCQILSTKRIGQPVFVRCALWEAPGKNEPAILLARLADLARHWLEPDFAEVFTNGHVENGPLSLALKCRQGASALLLYAQGRPGIDLMMLGSHGAIYFDELSGGSGHDSITTLGETESLTEEQSRFLDALRRSLRSGKPEPVLAGPPP